VIDPLTEQIITPREATRLYPRDHRGRKVHVATVYRHLGAGVRGIILESLRTPRLCTSKEAVSRFFRSLSERSVSIAPATQVVKQMTDRRIDEELDRLGL